MDFNNSHSFTACNGNSDTNQTARPVIALTPYHNTEKDELYMRPAYLKAITCAGGIPVILPMDITGKDVSRLVNLFDAFLFCGGPDVHPFYIREETHIHCGNVSARRDKMELTLLHTVMDRKKPVLGICRGIQLINIALGGDIYQDITSQFSSKFPIAHAQPFAYEIPSHNVTIAADSMLAQICDTHISKKQKILTLPVNSMHHQAIRRVAPGLTVSAYAPDGLAEAIENPEYPAFFLAVQWHPEYLWDQSTADALIFQKFVDAARQTAIARQK